MTEVTELHEKLPKHLTLKQYRPMWDVITKHFDGGVSIIDQWICAHAR